MSGCASSPNKSSADNSASVEKLYAEAEKPFKAGNYQTAIKDFEELESRYPYGRYAEQAQLNVAYSYYKMGESAAAVTAADRFIKLHPANPHVDYAYYLRGLAYYQSIEGPQRDPQPVHSAYDTFNLLITRFPASIYAPDARLRMAKALDILGEYELDVARYYFTRGAYLAAANRSEQVVTTYQLTPAREEALAIMAKSYAALGLPKLASDSVRVLRKNYPNSAYLRQLGNIPTS